MRPTIVFDAGSTHMNKIEYARELIRVGADAGADCVKFQLFKGEEYTKIGNIEMNRDWMGELVNYGIEKGIGVAASAFDEKAMELLFTLPVHHVKFAYSKRNQVEWIKASLNIGKLTVVSTDRFAMLSYPNDENLVKLYVYVSNGVTEYPVQATINFKNTFSPELYHGFSDHTVDIDVAVRAKQYGASWIEKHITLNYSDIRVPDIAFAIRPKQAIEFVTRLL